jgi:hypothetical protein
MDSLVISEHIPSDLGDSRMAVDVIPELTEECFDVFTRKLGQPLD